MRNQHNCIPNNNVSLANARSHRVDIGGSRSRKCSFANYVIIFFLVMYLSYELQNFFGMSWVHSTYVRIFSFCFRATQSWFLNFGWIQSDPVRITWTCWSMSAGKACNVHHIAVADATTHKNDVKAPQFLLKHWSKRQRWTINIITAPMWMDSIGYTFEWLCKAKTA